jgi:hypothetical protein
MASLPPPLPPAARVARRKTKIGAIIVVATTIAITAFVAGRMSTTAWPIVVADACVEYDKLRAEYVKAEREFEAKHSPYRWPLQAAVFRVFERPEAYLARVAVPAAYTAYVERQADCARQLAAAVRR